MTVDTIYGLGESVAGRGERGVHHVNERSEWPDMDPRGFVYRLRTGKPKGSMSFYSR